MESAPQIAAANHTALGLRLYGGWRRPSTLTLAQEPIRLLSGPLHPHWLWVLPYHSCAKSLRLRQRDEAERKRHEGVYEGAERDCDEYTHVRHRHVNNRSHHRTRGQRTPDRREHSLVFDSVSQGHPDPCTHETLRGRSDHGSSDRAVIEPVHRERNCGQVDERVEERRTPADYRQPSLLVHRKECRPEHRVHRYQRNLDAEDDQQRHRLVILIPAADEPRELGRKNDQPG